MTAVFDLRDVVREHPAGDARVTALAGISLRIHAGEYVVVLGPPGAGKTSLLQLLGALDRPTRGRVRFDGIDLGALDGRGMAALRRHTIGFVPQAACLVPTSTAAQNVEAALGPTGTRRGDRRARALSLLERVGLGARAGRLPAHFSAEDRQRVGIARALAHGPRVLLADEPAGGLDPHAGTRVVALLGGLCDEGPTVVVASGERSSAGPGARRIELRDGAVAFDSGGRGPAAGGAGGSAPRLGGAA